MIDLSRKLCNKQLMSYLSPSLRTVIQQQITTKTAQLDAANAAYLSSLTNSEVQTYTLDTGEGKQSTTRRKPEELANAISKLESEIQRLQRRLSGQGIINLNLRRHNGFR